MTILGIETSCDETACAILQNDQKRITILSNVVASSALLQEKFGGIIPEQAAREQIKSIIPVISEAITHSRLAISQIDAIAVTYGPGLIGSLLVGVETAKTLSIVWDKPLIPINHLIGHFYANWIARGDGEKGVPTRSRSERSRARMHGGISSWQDPEQSTPKFPCLGLLVSGGHTDLVLFPKERSSASFKDHNKYKYLGGTRDDAAGECFDKCARLLGLPYPGGPEISKLAQKGNPKAFALPRPMIDSKDYDFSFSGLKTAVANLLHTPPVILSEAKNPPRMRDSNKLRDPSLIVQDDNMLANLSASIEQAIVDVLVAKTIGAAQAYHVNQIMIAGGVAANQKLASDLELRIKNLELSIKLHIPPPNLCTDNAAMIAAAAFFNYKPVNPLSLQANPNLSL